LLSPDDYAEKSEGRHATLAANGDKIYELFEAYAKKKRQNGGWDVADRCVLKAYIGRARAHTNHFQILKLEPILSWTT